MRNIGILAAVFSLVLAATVPAQAGEGSQTPAFLQKAMEMFGSMGKGDKAPDPVSLKASKKSAPQAGSGMSFGEMMGAVSNSTAADAIATDQAHRQEVARQMQAEKAARAAAKGARFAAGGGQAIAAGSREVPVTEGGMTPRTDSALSVAPSLIVAPDGGDMVFDMNGKPEKDNENKGKPVRLFNRVE